MTLRRRTSLLSSLLLTVLAGQILTSPVTGNAGENPPPADAFTDISIGSPYLVQLNSLREQGIIKGYEDGAFRPHQKINRAEAAMLLKKGLLATEPSETEGKNPSTELIFSDLKKDHWAYGAVKGLASKNIINAKAVTFRPADTINLAEAVKMIIATEQLQDPELTLPTDSKSAFKDMKGTEWFAPYMQLANQKTLLSYSTKMTIAPAQEMTRGAFADLIYRALKTRTPGHFFGRGTFYSDSFEGAGTANGEKYRMNEYTAAHKTLPFGTKVKVIYLRNNQSVTVRVNDRGPFTPSLDLDLSRRAFSDLASPSEGIIPIEYEILKEEPVTPTKETPTSGGAIIPDEPTTPEAPPAN